jgi:hypothetical protein
MEDSVSPVTFRPLSLAELCALELPDLEWVVEDLLPRGTLTLLSAREKAGKSLLAAYLAACVAHGEPFLDRAVAQGPVLLVPAEEHLRDVRDRLLLAVGGVEAPVAVLPVNRGEDDALDLADPAALRELRRVVAELEPALVVLDPLRELHGLAENDADAMGPLLKPLRLLAQESDAAVMLIHHMSRAGQFRGSTAILAACDNDWSLRNADEGAEAGDELRGTLSVKGRRIPRQALGVRFGEGGRWEPAAPVPLPRASTRDEIVEFLAEAEQPATAEEIAGAIDAAVKTVQNLLGEERRTGRAAIVSIGAGRKNDPYRYLLAEAG